MRDRTPGSGLPRRALHVVAAVLGLTLLTAAPAAAAPSVGEVALGAPAGPVAAGATVDVRLDLRAVVDLYAYEATLTFDPALLAFEAVTSTPDGGFDDVVAGSGSVTVRHSRLGTSPGLDGDVAPTTVRLRALAGGTATVTLSGLTLVGADGVTDAAADVTSVAVVVTPAPTPTPTIPAPTTPAPTTPAPTATPTAAPTTSPDPTATPSGGATAAPAPTPSPTAGAAAPGTGALSATGAQVGALLAVALGAVALGAFLVRRRTAATR
ncbi:cohesin domain-containing protein [Cellulomonas phragmiteti]|uniref:Cohesin domain-containing protein n=1 Tax=Cellulomonas phragmiteti TaxID=478780 RepID=A0ABQ4DLJ2_9CELL|nr:cohesin domain-containing protein [Cellulomonas phragmiteti]GIG40196.1 hypothetical protein Cph01nite_19580 [Cellulomonas phragmiteti]